MPALHLASDVMFGFWLRDNPNPKNLRYYVAANVQNDETQRLVATILKKKEVKGVPQWPGVKVGVETDEGRVLLGKSGQSLVRVKECM